LSLSDGELVRATLEGDKRAFGELYDRYARLIRVICNDKAGDVTIALDLAQEAFLRAYKKLDRLEDAERFGAWLISITRNVCREFRRGKFRDRHVLVGLSSPDFDIVDDAEPDERVEQLHRAMQELSEKERLALHVYYLQNQDARQSQKLLGVSHSGLYRLLEKARRKLERILEREDED